MSDLADAPSLARKPSNGSSQKVVADLHKRANEVFGNEEKARSWLSKPRQQFSGKSPLEMLSNQEGVIAVKNLLGQIEHGMFG